MADKIGRIFFPGAYSRSEEVADQEKRLRAERQREILQRIPDLQDQYTPQEVSSIVRRYIEGEGINLPTMRAKMIPKSNDPYAPQGSTLEPLKYLEPSTTFVDKATGTFKIVPGENAKMYGNDAEPVDIINFDEETGTTKKVGTTSKGSKVITTKKDKSTGKGPKTPKELQDQVALGVLKNYFTLEATGGDLEKIRPSAISAAKRFGMSIDSIKEDPSFFQRIFGGEGGDIEKPSFTPPGVRASEDKKPSFKSADEVKAAYKTGKISKEKATAILQSEFGYK